MIRELKRNQEPIYHYELTQIDKTLRVLKRSERVESIREKHRGRDKREMDTLGFCVKWAFIGKFYTLAFK